MRCVVDFTCKIIIDKKRTIPNAKFYSAVNSEPRSADLLHDFTSIGMMGKGRNSTCD